MYKIAQIRNWLILTTLFLLQAYLIRFSIFEYPSNLQEVLIIAVSILTLTHLIQTRQVIIATKKIAKNWVILSFLGLTVISAITNDIENKTDFIRHLKFLFFALLLLINVIISTERPSHSSEKKNTLNLKQLLQALSYGALTFGIFSLIYNLSGHNTSFDHRLMGPLDAAVYLGFYLAPFTIFTGIEWLKEKTNYRNLAVFLTLLALLLLTKSMGAIAGAITMIGLHEIITKGRKFFESRTHKILGAIILITLSGAIFYTKILPTINTDYSSLDERGEIWTTAKDLLKDKKTFLFGAGLSQFEANYKNQVVDSIGKEPLDFNVIQPHNIFLLFIFNYGLIGLLFIIFIYLKTAQTLFMYWKHQKSASSNEKNEYQQMIFTFILSYFLLHGLIDTPFYKNDLLFIFLLATNYSPKN